MEGELSGTASFHIGGMVFECEYKDGQPYEGVHFDKDKWSGPSVFHYYNSGVRTTDSLVYQPSQQLMLYRDGAFFKGRIRDVKNQAYFKVYEEGVLTMLVELPMTDTISVTTYSGNKSTTVNKAGEVIMTGQYEGDYETGTLSNYEGGEIVNTVDIENGTLVKGCIEKSLDKRMAADRAGHFLFVQMPMEPSSQ